MVQHTLSRTGTGGAPRLQPGCRDSSGGSPADQLLRRFLRILLGLDGAHVSAPPARGTLLSGPRTRLAAGFGDSHFRCMFESMLTSRLISADVCGTVMDSLSVQMAQVPPCPRLRVACAPRAPRRFAAALDAGAYGACACPLVGGRGAGRSGSWVGRSSAQTGSSLLRIQRAPPGGGRGARCSGGSLVTASRHGSRAAAAPSGCRRRGPRPDAAVPCGQAALSHAKSPMQMMAAKQQLMVAKSRQDAERMQFNCF